MKLKNKEDTIYPKNEETNLPEVLSQKGLVQVLKVMDSSNYRV